jgi:hypothetical protein
MKKKEQEKSIDQTPTTSNPQEFVERFLNSEEYSVALEEFYKGKNIRPDVTEAIKRRVFHEKEEARLALISFAQRRLHYSYDSSALPSEVSELVEIYADAARSLNEAQAAGDRDAMINQDSHRSSVHNALANRLVDTGVVPSANLGLGFAGLILISKDLQTYKSLLVDRRLKTQGQYR